MFRKTKSKLAVLLSLALCVSMMASTSVFAADEKEVESYSTFITFDDESGEPIEIKVPHYADTPNYTLPSGATVFDGVQEVVLPEFQPFNYRSDWAAVSNVTLNPYNGIAQLVITYADGSKGYGTGFVVGDGKVLTAAHNLYSAGKGGVPKSVVLTFLRTTTTGIEQSIPVSSRFIPDDWYADTTGSNAANDYGIIKVGTAAKMKFGLYSGAFTGTNYTISGYPWVSGSTKYTSKKMHTDTTKLASPTATLDGTVKHDSNICVGVSGAPMYASNNYAVAIQTYGNSKLVNTDGDDIEYEGENKRGGFATLITRSVIDFVRNA